MSLFDIKANILTCHLSTNDGNRAEFSQSFSLATLHWRPAETLRKLRLHKVTLLRRLRRDGRGTPQCSLRSKKVCTRQHWSTFSIAAIIPLILLCPLSYSLNEYDGNPLASRHQYFMHLSAWKQCHRPQLIGRRLKRSETMSQWKRDKFITLNFSVQRFGKHFVSHYWEFLSRAFCTVGSDFLPVDTLIYSSIAEEKHCLL